MGPRLCRLLGYLPAGRAGLRSALRVPGQCQRSGHVRGVRDHNAEPLKEDSLRAGVLEVVNLLRGGHKCEGGHKCVPGSQQSTSLLNSGTASTSPPTSMLGSKYLAAWESAYSNQAKKGG